MPRFSLATDTIKDFIPSPKIQIVEKNILKLTDLHNGNFYNAEGG